MQITGFIYPPFIDTQALVHGSSDSTKKFRFEVDGFTTATTRVGTVPDADFTFVGVALTQTLTNKTLTNVILDGTTPLVVNQTVATSGSPKMLTFNAASHTTLTASTELIDASFVLNRTVQFATGSLTLQRAFVVGGPTYTFVGPSVITTAVTCDITAPIAGANATITNNFAIRSNGTLAVNTSSVNAIVLQNSAQISATGTDAGITFIGNRNAGSATADFLLNSSVTRTSGNLFSIQNNASAQFTVGFAGSVTIQPSAQSSGTLRALTILTGAHTGQTASTEISNIQYSSYTRTWAAGAITTQREISIGAPTYAFASASTITTAATVSISGAPVAGTNATITTRYALLIESGNIGISNGDISFTGGSSKIIVSAANTSLTCVANISAAGTGVDFIFNTTQTRTAGSLMAVRNNGTARFTVSFHGGVSVAQGAAATGTPQLLQMAMAAHTNMTASTEVNFVNFNMNVTPQWATGAITTQRCFLVQAPTLSFVGSSTVTTAATFAISGSPVAGTNATITNSYSLWVQGGKSQFDGVVIAQGATAIPAGGTAGTGLFFSTTANFGIMFGSGAPSASAAKGTLYIRSDGSGTNNRAYINTDGGTTWTAITTVA